MILPVEVRRKRAEKFPKIEEPPWPHLSGQESLSEMRAKLEAHQAGDFFATREPYLCELCECQNIQPPRNAYWHCMSCGATACEDHANFLVLSESEMQGAN